MKGLQQTPITPLTSMQIRCHSNTKPGNEQKEEKVTLGPKFACRPVHKHGSDAYIRKGKLKNFPPPERVGVLPSEPGSLSFSFEQKIAMRLLAVGAGRGRLWERG